MEIKRKERKRKIDRTLPAGKFKDLCLSLMDDVSKYGGQIVITKHGKVVAKLVPGTEKPQKRVFFGCLAGSVIASDDDLTSSVDEHWGEDFES